MSERQPTRAELLERIAASSKEAVVLAEMQRLGFWPDAAQPTPQAALIEREHSLVQALNALQGELATRTDPEAALRALRRQRMQDALARREATAQAREQARHARALRWHALRDTQVGYLGEGAMALPPGEAEGGARPQRLRSQGLPPLETPQALAEAMGLGVRELKFLCFHREVATLHHYRRFSIPKKTGGERVISAPMPRLKRAQYWVLDNILARVACHPAAHGFLPGRSIVGNAAPHCGREVVVNIDLQDFFPSIRLPRIRRVFEHLGYGRDVATCLALLCSENRCDELSVDGARFFVGGKARERSLPQGAPTSPMISNLVCRALDRRLQPAADQLGFDYTRYADDLSFSARTPEAAAQVGRLMRRVRHIVRDCGFTPHPDKQQVMRAGRRQEVTGVVVNAAQPSVSRQQRRVLRAALHRARTQGIERVTWQGAPASRAVLEGYARFVHMVSPAQGVSLLAQAVALARPAVAAPPIPAAPPRETFRRQAAQGLAPSRAAGPWWTPVPRPEPVLQLTAGQLRAQRQARLNAARAARRAEAAGQGKAATAAPAGFAAASQRGSGQPPLPEVAVPPSGPATEPPVPWGRLLVQLILLFGVAGHLQSAVVLMVGTFWWGIQMLLRQWGWPRFLIGLVLAVGASVLLRDLQGG